MSGASSRAWTWRHAFASSELPATTKHVLHTLGMFMNEVGEGCYPSVADICRYSGLDKKTVLKHLAAARDAGWIAVSQHGYRGQKWKRNEYAARWPDRDVDGRDLVAPCPPDGCGEGGGAAPPPCEAVEVVDPVPQGGGTEGSKVVEEVHQDKTTPTTPPDTSPVEREARARDDGQEGEEAGEGRGSRKAIERAFERAFRDWPTSISDSRPEAWKAWSELSPDERDAAAAEAARYVEACRNQAGRQRICSHGVYLREKRWERLPDANAAAEPARFEPAFGPAFAVFVWRELVGGPQAPLPGPKSWEADAVAAGRLDGERLRLDRQARHGWPELNRLFTLAGRGGTAIPEGSLDHLKHLVEPVPVGSAVWQAWKLEHERRGWPWADGLGFGRAVYFPKGGPQGLAEFEEAVRGAEHFPGSRHSGDGAEGPREARGR